MNARPTPKASQPCPCGSGRKYKDCCGAKLLARRRLVRRTRKVLIWAAAIAVVGSLVYAVSLTWGVAYGEREIGVVDFSGLSAKAKRTALQAANSERCPCGCGMGLAQCVAIDTTCPLRNGHIDQIRLMVKQASVE